MVEKQVVQVPGLRDSTPSAYAQCVTAGDLVFVAGQIGTDQDSNLVSLEFGPQARQALANLRLALEAAGATLRDIVTMTVFLADMRSARELLEIRKEILGTDFAASAMLGGLTFARPGALIEIQAIAVRGSAPRS
jgi:2-iminobutanoate/2-iminopropanoate deaminase